ncbi:cytochrome c [Gemmobacter sp.]|uniref:c-type cytochrome n=1 Tax=Gemmobacter sp. TaxID=1898957 RepID=UPI002AFFE2DB|nr:cytochrome c [Gemmobacter sp.]
MRVSSFLLALLSALPATAQDAARGAATFQHHCATCHGVAADGAGPMAAVLTVPPTDLTRLAAGGAFPTIRVVMRIDGRDALVAHGSPMPLFGQLYDRQDTTILAPDGTPVLTSRDIADLVAHLVAVQQ